MDLSNIVVAIIPEAPTTGSNLTLGIAHRQGQPVPEHSVVWYQNGVETPRFASLNIPAADTARGDFYKADVVFSDGSILSATTEILNSPPEATLAFDADVVNIGDDLAPTATAEDLDGDPLTYTWSWKRDGVLQPDATGELLPALRTGAGETWTAELIVSDGDADSEVASASVNVLDGAPLITDVQITPASPNTTDTLTAVVSVSDPEGDPIELSFAWFVDGVEVQTGSDTLPSVRTDKGVEVTVEVIASDNSSSTAPFTSQPVLVENSVPTYTGIRFEPASVDERGTLSCLAEGHEDLDGDPDQGTVLWTINGVDRPFAGDVLDGGDFNRGDSVVCTRTPFDGDDLGTPFTLGPLTVSNAPPELQVTGITPDPPREGDVVSPIYTVSDADGDTVDVDVTWIVDGLAISTAPTLSSASFAKLQTVRAQLSASDGIDTSALAQTPQVVVANSPPVVLDVGLSTGAVFTDSVLMALVSTTDLDGDARELTYQWFVNNTLVRPPDLDPTLSGATAFNKGDEVFVIVSAFDGTDNSLPLDSNVVTIANKPPAAPLVSLDPTPIYPGETARCVIDEVPFDADGDVITYSVSWTLNGQPYTGAVLTTNLPGDTLPAGLTVDDEVWGCAVVANDGTDASEPGPAEQVVADLGKHPLYPAANCSALQAARPTYPSGDYWLDPDNDGDATNSLLLPCDMVHDGGGWTGVLHDDFEDGVDPAWSLQLTTVCPSWSGTVLGGYGILAGGATTRLVGMLSIPHSQVRITGEVLTLDSWEQEEVRIELDGSTVWSQEHWTIVDAVTNSCGNSNSTDLAYPIDGTVFSGANVVELALVADLDESPFNESVGLEEITVWIR